MTVWGEINRDENKKALRNAAKDHALLLHAICFGVAKWRPFEGSADNGELCVGGLAYATALDVFGCPIMTMAFFNHLLSELAKHKEKPC